MMFFGQTNRMVIWGPGLRGDRKKGGEDKAGSGKNEVDLEHNSPHAVVLKSLVMMTTFSLILIAVADEKEKKFRVEIVGSR